jgi:exodeoxyribonuclease VIII
MDYYREDLGVIFDLKTTTDARPQAVQRDIMKYGYHKSAAHYLNGCRALGIPGDNFAWIFIEKEPPYAIGLYFCSPDLLLRGEIEMEKYAAEYFACKRSGEWPAYSPEFQTIDAPSWAQ